MQDRKFLRGSLDLVPVSLLVKPQLETPSWTQKTTVTSSPAGCPGNGQPRDTIDGGSKVFFINHDRGGATRPNVSAKDDPSPARTRFHVRRKTNGTRGALFSWNPHATRYAKQDWEEKIRSSLSVKENSFQHAQNFTCTAKPPEQRALFYCCLLYTSPSPRD